MSDYNVEIEGQDDLASITLQIAGEEAGASEFASSVVSVKNNKPTNVVTFRTLPAGTIPNALQVVKQNDPQPAGTTKVWTGTMIVSGTNMAVTAYRAT